MTPEQAHLVMIRGTIAGETPEKQAQVFACADELRRVIKDSETVCEGVGYAALVLVLAEFAAS